jgi:hypothetical protein
VKAARPPNEPLQDDTASSDAEAYSAAPPAPLAEHARTQLEYLTSARSLFGYGAFVFAGGALEAGMGDTASVGSMDTGGEHCCCGKRQCCPGPRQSPSCRQPTQIRSELQTPPVSQVLPPAHEVAHSCMT